MTLTEALQRLHEAGKIKDAWLPGMRVLHPGGLESAGSMERHDIPLRAYDENEEPAIAGDPWSIVEGYDGSCSPKQGPEWTPDLTDPATLGCLLALVREASGDPVAYTVPWSHGPGGFRWVVMFDPRYDTNRAVEETSDTDKGEGAALSAALVALAEQP